ERGPRPGESSLYNRDLEFLAQLTKDASIMEAHRALRTWSAPLAKFAEKAKKAPLVVLAPAPGAFVTDCTALAEELASHGIVVASAASPGVTLMRRGDRGGSRVWSRWEDAKGAAERDATVAADLRLAFDDLIEHSRKPGSLLHDRLDEAKLGAIGVRASAAAAIKAADDDPRIQVVASIEGPEIQSPRSAKYFRVIGEAPGNATDSPFQFPERYRGGRPAGEVAATILKTTRERLQNSLASATPATR
ncbi:MAG TPA: hypothetical protein VNC50_14335, partial [Planctomycetia bacterium]|nr:hypothetical protein [Planctomycetia bacterium]